MYVTIKRKYTHAIQLSLSLAICRSSAIQLPHGNSTWLMSLCPCRHHRLRRGGRYWEGTGKSTNTSGDTPWKNWRNYRTSPFPSWENPVNPLFLWFIIHSKLVSWLKSLADCIGSIHSGPMSICKCIDRIVGKYF